MIPTQCQFKDVLKSDKPVLVDFWANVVLALPRHPPIVAPSQGAPFYFCWLCMARLAFAVSPQ